MDETRPEIDVPKRINGNAQSNFGARLAEFRRAAGYSQSELGAELGISQRMVAYYEGETDYPPSGILPALARVLGVSTDELLGVKFATSTPKKPRDSHFLRRLKQAEKLPAKERRQILQFVDTYLEREKLRTA